MVVGGAHPTAGAVVRWALPTTIRVLLLFPFLAAAGPPPLPPAPLDPAEWQAAPAAGVAMQLAAARGPDGAPALRIDYDFQGRGGWAAARLPLDLELPTYYEIRFLLRGEGSPNNLELKLVDPSGTNVWWHVKRDFAWPAEWTPMRVRKRQVTFAWGPLGGGEPRRIGALELTVSASSGGRGSVEVAGLAVVPVEPPAPVTAPLRAEASSEEAGNEASDAVDDNEHTYWVPAGDGPAELVVDLGGLRELGGLTIVWGRPAPMHAFVELSSDGKEWTGVREMRRSRRGRYASEPRRTHVMLTDGEARLVRVRLPDDAGCEGSCKLAELIVRPLAFGASRNDFFTALAREAPRGAFPRGFTEAVYWTVVGNAGAADEVLVSEDGAVEVGERGFSLEPMVYLDDRSDDRLFTWADVTTEQTLADGDLPIPTVVWRIAESTATSASSPTATPAAATSRARLEITVIAVAEPGQTRHLVRYRLVNESADRLRGQLFVVARPFQVNPPHQFLNVAGGVAPLGKVTCVGGLSAGGWWVWALPMPRCGVLAFDDGLPSDALADLYGDVPPTSSVEDPQEAANGVLAWEIDLQPGEDDEGMIGVVPPANVELPRGVLDLIPFKDFPAVERAERRRWRRALDRVTFDLPDEAAPLLRTLRSNLAFIEIHRDGPALQPGSRAYARSWIRDGALTGAALLRMGHADTAASFARWFAGYQYPDGKVPCCVDRRGADPVPEHDSHGELVHLIAEVYRYTGDRAFAEELFPHVERAVDAIEALRQQRRTADYAKGPKQVFFGLLPESISHEGYSSRPVHSYWDDTFAYRGLDDAVELARALGRDALAVEWARRRDEFRADLLASIARVRKQHRLVDLPASADLADFDSTSTTTMLDPGGLLPFLPRDAVLATFERFWREVSDRRAGRKEWEGYTPYELRHVGAFVRLHVATGDLRWRDRAHELLAGYLRDQRPPGWNAWPEVVHRDARAARFLGDLPHGWVGSDFIRSFLDLFAFEREAGPGTEPALVLGAGIPPSWLDRPQGITVEDVATPWGPLTYTLERIPDFPLKFSDRLVAYRYWLSGGLKVPPGGIVLVPPTREPHQQPIVDGNPVERRPDGTAVVHQLPAVVEFLAFVPREEEPDER